MNDIFYKIIDKIKESVSNSKFNNKVTFGDITEVDLGKLTNFPLAHVIVESAEISERTVSYNVRLLVCDVVDVNKDYVDDNDFYGNSNTQDILNTQFHVINKLVRDLMKNDLRDNGFTAVSEGGTISATPFRDRFENELAGWETEMTVMVFNDIGCDD